MFSRKAWRWRAVTVGTLWIGLITAVPVTAQTQNPPQAAPAGVATGQSSANPNGSPAVSDPVAPNAIQPAANPEQSNSPAQSASPQGQEENQAPANGQGDVFVFKKEVQEVILHATVVDGEHHLVTNLDRSAFSVFENNAPQVITSFRLEDAPVAIGIVIDNSGSMREKREKVNQAVLNLIGASNPKDEVFLVNFSQDSYLDQDFTSDASLIRQALQQVSAQGETALYDAIVASAVHLKNNPRIERKVLLVITDGQDNSSGETLQQAVQRLQLENGPVLYAIGLTGDGMKQSGHDALQTLSDSTGGVAFFTPRLEEVDSVTRAIAHDIRSQYTIGYKPTRPRENGGYRSIQVLVRMRNYRSLTARTRSGYYPGEPVH